MTQTLAIIIPCHNEEENIAVFYHAVQKALAPLPAYQPLFWYINDGSTDHTLMAIQQLQQADKDVHYIDFSRGFGKEAGMYAGLQNAKADLYVIMDADLQDPPEMLPEMLAGIADGYEMVGAARVDRTGEPILRSFFSNLFYKLMKRISQADIVPGARDFRVMTPRYVDAVLSLSEHNRFSKGIFGWIGFKSKYLPYKNVERQYGQTSWSFTNLFKYSLDGIIDFSDAPLTFVSWVGLFSFVTAGLALLFIVIRALIYGDPTPGWPSLVSIFLMFGGLQLFALGILGRYIGKIYIEVKNRPIYIAKEIK
ncbi:glycosyltransferase family 2 protein [Lacticaseibacillus baoqingensis]|uniref:Glycosyltransferase family 2 protein n=1 Tax=Lacticaseibacillus baoqingensis TaxID=2486013 RepID=A0ABW4E9W3_9LACO|nr:glycosyltransferase family 2 protein [Lacticaseibacillus baoqingensis]